METWIREPSHCFVHEGDGVCEEFERPYSVSDCGFYTPPGYSDQWASLAIANPTFQGPNCPESFLLGMPSFDQKCVSNTVPTEYWSPCNSNGKPDNFWIEVFFLKPKVATEIIIHFGSDGIDELNSKQTIRIELLTNENATKTLPPELHSISCAHNPIHIPIIQDLSKPFFLTKGIRIRFSSPRISIAAVRMRSSKYLHPVTLSTCNDMEMFDPVSARCVNTSCDKQTCGNLRIKHGIPTCNGYREGNICQVECNQGYQLDGIVNEFICVDGSWQSYSPLSCIPVDCGEPYIPYASISCPDGFQFGDKCHFNCKLPAKLQGDISTIQCDADRTWSLPNSFCQIHCRAPSISANTRLMTKACKRGYHLLGKVCKLKCEKNFRVEGKSNIRRIYKLECGEDGLWHGEYCIPVTCPTPDIIFKGLYICTENLNVGSKCTMICPERSLKQTITCGIDGRWDKHFNICTSAVNRTCPDIHDSSDVKFDCNGNKVGEQCTVDCFLPKATPIISGRLADNTEQNKNNRNTVRKLTCTALLEWTPNPETISCKVGCDTDYIGDSLCQAEYNTKECSWDGGDCCESTVFDGMVISIPFTCGKPCTCLDPTAIENSISDDKIKPRRKSSKSKLMSLSRYSWKKKSKYSGDI